MRPPVSMESTRKRLKLVSDGGGLNIFNCDDSWFPGKLNPLKEVVVPKRKQDCHPTPPEYEGLHH